MTYNTAWVYFSGACLGCESVQLMRVDDQLGRWVWFRLLAHNFRGVWDMSCQSVQLYEMTDHKHKARELLMYTPGSVNSGYYLESAFIAGQNVIAEAQMLSEFKGNLTVGQLEQGKDLHCSFQLSIEALSRK